MTDTTALPGLFPMEDDDAPETNIVRLRNTGILPSQEISALIEEGGIAAHPSTPIDENQLQPASLDLRLGARAYRIPASFLPGSANVMDKIRQLDGIAMDLCSPDGVVMEKGAVYVVELIERLGLTSGTEGTANPKSSTGRLDVLTRLITDRAAAFDRIERNYHGPLYIEIAPLTFSILVRRGSRLNQVRFHRGQPILDKTKAQQFYEAGQLVGTADRLPLRGALVPVSVDLEGGDGGIVGYKAKKSTNIIDLNRVGHYRPAEFWEKIEATDGRLNLDPNEFYILATREDVGVPPHLAAEMVPYDTNAGEFRVHYAGFFDPGFGWRNGKAEGSKAVLEIRSHGIPFTLEHGQVVGWLRYSQLAVGKPDRLYGEDISSNYQGQRLALAKHFRPWTE
ncbi:MAG: 2'-deoxycytidine 5'-triphosphate deaminase [Hyphomicrobiales bacterium]